MSAWVPHRKHTRHRRAVHAPARAEARRRRDIERGRVAERLRPRTTTSRLTCAESSASEFLEGPSLGPRATGPSLGPRHGEQTRGLHGLRPLSGSSPRGADPRTARFGEQTRGLHGLGSRPEDCIVLGEQTRGLHDVATRRAALFGCDREGSRGRDCWPLRSKWEQTRGLCAPSCAGRGADPRTARLGEQTRGLHD